jgi:hypothetical protein
LSGSEFPLRQPKSSRVVIGRNTHGEWVVLDQEGRCGGIFVSRDTAQKFALEVNGHRLEAIELFEGPLELTIGGVALRSQSGAVETAAGSRGKTRPQER